LQTGDFIMSDEKLYAFFFRPTFAYQFMLMTQDGQPVGLTVRQFVDYEVVRWNKAGFLLEVEFNDFLDDAKESQEKSRKLGFNFSNFGSKYTKMLGWNYGEAARLLDEDRRIFVFVPYPGCEGRVYSYELARDDDEYALQLVRDIYGTRGGQIVMEEFDPDKHVKGCLPNLKT
jgi:hypothetical protein